MARSARKFLFGFRAPTTPRGQRAYVVGDVHGRLDLLQTLLGQIEEDARPRRPVPTTIVFLGDLIDRGPSSAQVLEFLRKYRPKFAKTAFVMGNHEEAMLRAIGGDIDVLTSWRTFGGSECLTSYGLAPDVLERLSSSEVLALVRARVPETHVRFLRSFADSISFGDYLLVHAGIRPGTPLEDQLQSDLRWIRDPFLEDDRDHGCLVVHGHTISAEVDVRSNRIGIDTGAYRTGVLTALGLEGSDRWLLQTRNTKPFNTDPAIA